MFQHGINGMGIVQAELGISRATANRRWQYGIAVIVWRLNGRSVPSKRSMEFVATRAKHLAER